MHESLIFPLKCVSKVITLTDPKVIEVKGEFYICSSNTDKDKCAIYDSFDYPELIPELISLVEKVKIRGYNKNNQIKKWVERWGVLEFQLIDGNTYGQNINEFWKMAEDFYVYWRLYKEIANRNEKSLNTVEKFLEEDGELLSLSDDPFENKQWNTLRVVYQAIKKHIKNGELGTDDIQMVKEGNEDKFEITPALHFVNLIDCLYMQFFIALNENKKVCPVCNKPFTPERTDRVYCSDTCRHTAKSRRHRARKAKTT